MSEVVTAPNSPLVSFIERAAINPDFDVQKFGELLRMQREVEHDQARKAFNRAMAAAQAEMLPIVRDAKNSHLNNKYAKLETIDAAIRPIYTGHGFSVRYGSSPSPHEGWMRITCTVAHDAGYFEENYLDAPVSTTGSQGGRMAITPVQAIGSTITYLRRYLLGMCWNAVLADDDDDGEGFRPAVAASVQRAPRRSEPTNGNGHPATRTKEQWDVWTAKLGAAVRVVHTQAEVEEIARRPTVADALADPSTPDVIKRDITAILAEGYARFVVTDAPIENDPLNDPGAGDHPDGGPRIAGEQYAGV